MSLLLLLVACAHAPADAPTPEPAPAPAATAPAAPSPPPSAPVVFGEADPNGNPTVLSTPPTDPAGLYAGCKVRVEGTESAGECTTAADCVAAGCSHEVCVAKAKADGLQTTCDTLPCFAVLDQCGCTAGLCTWTLKP